MKWYDKGELGIETDREKITPRSYSKYKKFNLIALLLSAATCDFVITVCPAMLLYLSGFILQSDRLKQVKI